MKWSSSAAGLRGRTLEDVFEIMVVVVIETTNHQWFLGTLELPFDVTVICAGVCLESQTAVGPQLPIGAESVRCLDQGDQESSPNRTDVGNLA